jgi:Na+-translocating ferredoxin:NAD+ oxidoreductase RnfD subunit
MTTPPRGMRDTPGAMAWTLCALAPAVLLEAFARGGAWVFSLLLAIASAMAVAVLANRSGQPITSWFLANLDAAVAASLVFLLLYADANPWLASAATVLSVLLARNLFGGLGQNIFNPAMLALAMLGLQATAPPTPTQWSQWTVIACWVAGGVLLARGLVSWRAPAAFVAGALAAAALSGNPDDGAGAFTVVLGNPALVICAFFVAGEPVTSCIHPRARLAYGLCAGALVVLFLSWQPVAGLPFAMLLMNFMAPWFDQVLNRQRRKAIAR